MQKKWIFLLSLLCNFAQANTLEEAKLRIQQKDFSAAHTIYLKLANEGNAKACFNLGLMFNQGDGVSQNMEEAVKWYSKSADLNYKEAQYTLASLRFRREFESISYIDAAQYYQKAAEQGHVKSQLNLGILYYRGDILPQDLETSFKWLSLAASNNDSEAQGYIANFFNQGIGVKKDIVKAAMWLMLAKQNEDQRFINRHSKMLNLITMGMTPAQKEIATRQALECKTLQLKDC